MLRDPKALRTEPVNRLIRAGFVSLLGIALIVPAGLAGLNVAKSDEKADASTTEFFGIPEKATSLAYVLDRSGSMATRGALDMTKHEFTKSMDRLSAGARFAVVFYNLTTLMFSDPQGQKGLMVATKANKTAVETQLSKVTTDGGTDHMAALRETLAVRPEAIFFLTDADLMTDSEVRLLVGDSGSTRINTIQLGRGDEADVANKSLRMLASLTKGKYRYFDVNKFPKP